LRRNPQVIIEVASFFESTSRTMFWPNATDQPCGVFQNIVRESTFEKTRTYPSHRWIGTRVSYK